MTPEENDLQDLRALNPRFVCIAASGAMEQRTAYLHDWASGFDPEVIPYRDVRDENIALFGDVALVRSTNKHVRRIGGQEVTGMTTYTDTYLRESGRWLCVQAQLTAVAPEHWPADETIVNRYIGGQLQARR